MNALAKVTIIASTLILLSLTFYQMSKLSVGDCVQLKQSYWNSLVNAQKSPQSKAFILSLEAKCGKMIYKISKREGTFAEFEKNKCAANATIFEPSDIFNKVSCKKN